jgi:hypothetical protein
MIVHFIDFYGEPVTDMTESQNEPLLISDLMAGSSPHFYMYIFKVTEVKLHLSSLALSLSMAPFVTT